MARPFACGGPCVALPCLSKGLCFLWCQVSVSDVSKRPSLGRSCAGLAPGKTQLPAAEEKQGAPSSFSGKKEWSSSGSEGDSTGEEGDVTAEVNA